MSFKVTFSSSPAFKVEFDHTVEIQMGDFYTGEYTVIPKAEKEQILPTKDLIMADDLTVTKVPYFETSNQFGETIYIASEV